MLKTRVFLGQYQEKRFVDAVKNYRDLIVINHTESEVIRDFEAVQNRVLREYGGTQQLMWFGFTGGAMIGAPSGSCIWTELSENIPFGEYWFQVKIKMYCYIPMMVKSILLIGENRPIPFQRSLGQIEGFAGNASVRPTQTEDNPPATNNRNNGHPRHQ